MRTGSSRVLCRYASHDTLRFPSIASSTSFLPIQPCLPVMRGIWSLGILFQFGDSIFVTRGSEVPFQRNHRVSIRLKQGGFESCSFARPANVSHVIIVALTRGLSPAKHMYAVSEYWSYMSSDECTDSLQEYLAI